MKNYRNFNESQVSKETLKEFFEDLQKAFRDDPAQDILDAMPKEGISYKAWTYALIGACQGAQEDNICIALGFKGWVDKFLAQRDENGWQSEAAYALAIFIKNCDLRDKKHQKTLTRFLNAGFDVNTVIYKDDGGSLMSVAVLLESIPLLQLLERAGASINHAKETELSKDRVQALSQKEKEQLHFYNAQPMRLAVERANPQILDWFISKKESWREDLWGNLPLKMIALLGERSYSAWRIEVIRKMAPYCNWRSEAAQTVEALAKISASANGVNDLYASCMYQASKVHQICFPPDPVPSPKEGGVWSHFVHYLQRHVKKGGQFNALVTQKRDALQQEGVLEMIQKEPLDSIQEHLLDALKKEDFSYCAQALWLLLCAKNVGYFNDKNEQGFLAQKSFDTKALRALKQILPLMPKEVFHTPINAFHGMTLAHAIVILDDVSALQSALAQDPLALSLRSDQEHLLSAASCAFLATSEQCLEYLMEAKLDLAAYESFQTQRRHVVHVLVDQIFNPVYLKHQDAPIFVKMCTMLESLLLQSPHVVDLKNEDGCTMEQMMRVHGEKLQQKLEEHPKEKEVQKMLHWHQTIDHWVKRAQLAHHVQKHHAQHEGTQESAAPGWRSKAL